MINVEPITTRTTVFGLLISYDHDRWSTAFGPDDFLEELIEYIEQKMQALSDEGFTVSRSDFLEQGTGALLFHFGVDSDEKEWVSTFGSASVCEEIESSIRGHINSIGGGIEIRDLEFYDPEFS